MQSTTNYSVIKEKHETEELGCYESYGILAECGDETQLISDITTDPIQAAEMAECFNRNQLSLLHFHEVIQDMLG